MGKLHTCYTVTPFSIYVPLCNFLIYVFFPHLEDDIGFLLNPGPPSDHSFPPFTTPTYPIVTTEASKNPNSVLNEIPEDFSQNPEHISMISQYPISYKDTDKLIGKPKLVGGSLTNYRPRPKII